MSADCRLILIVMERTLARVDIMPNKNSPSSGPPATPFIVASIKMIVSPHTLTSIAATIATSPLAPVSQRDARSSAG